MSTGAPRPESVTLFTDEEWAEYQRLPDQGFSHRHLLESLFQRKAAAREQALREEIAGEIEAALIAPIDHADARYNCGLDTAELIARGDDE